MVKGKVCHVPTQLVLALLVTLIVLLAGSTLSEGHTHEIGSGKPLPWHEHVHQLDNESIAFNVSLDAVAVEESLYFIRKLFDKYGDDDGLSHNHLLALLKEIGMDVDKMKDSLDKSHVVTRSVTDVQHIHSAHDKGTEKTMEANNLKNEGCVTVHEMLSAFHLGPAHPLTPQEFSYLCPAIVYQLHKETCRSAQYHNHDHHHDHDHSHSLGLKPDHNHDDSHDHDTKVHPAADLSSIPSKVWGFSCIAVLVISLVGLLGVAVIPIMQKVFYNHLLQFLVALAIGALSGDALLHLLPHAIMAESEHKHGGSEGEQEEEHNHKSAAFKGLVALLGILFFFIVERLLTIITVIKRNRRSEKQVKKRRCAKYCDIESNKKSIKAKLSERQTSEDGCDRTVMLVHPNKEDALVNKDFPMESVSHSDSSMALRGLADAAHDEFMHQCDDDISSPSQTQLHPIVAHGHANGDSKHAHKPRTETLAVANLRHGTDEDNVASDKDVEMMEMIGGFESSIDGDGHVMGVSSGHSHGSHHGHAHSVPNSVAAVAWMVILGDGIHNFSDGLAIGAAFSSSITGGFSTSIAVFCHELPHEIGDFAVLLRAGMTAKQAIMYNCLSSLLCFVGMLIGVALGNLASVSEWIFACVGGMFLYIALVDMLPEMTSVDPKKGENPFLHLLLQVLGIILGSSIMLIIAIFEHDIKHTFGDA